MKLLITGGCGFLGSNLVSEALKQGIEVVVIDNLSRNGSRENLAWLKKSGKFAFHEIDVRDPAAIIEVVRNVSPDAIFHFAGQVAMTTSIANPRLDFEVNALGTFNILEAVRQHAPSAAVLYSSTNKVYGDLLQYRYEEQATRYKCLDLPEGFDESVPLSFHSPYGCSKGSADQYMLDYARIFGLKTVVFRHSSMYGGRQFATYDQGWVGWFTQQAYLQANGSKVPFTISGNGKQVRDVLHASDIASLYFKTVEHIDVAAGEAFNVGGGIQNSLSLLELFALLEKLTGKTLKYEEKPARESDQLVFVAALGKIEKLVGWKPRVSAEEGLKDMLQWVAQCATAGI